METKIKVKFERDGKIFYTIRSRYVFNAIMMDKRFYVVHFDLDTLIEELDATAIITGLPAYDFEKSYS